MIATDELEYTLNRIMLLENNVEDTTEKKWTHMVGENLANMLKQLRVMEQRVIAERELSKNQQKPE